VGISVGSIVVGMLVVGRFVVGLAVTVDGLDDDAAGLRGCFSWNTHWWGSGCG
jgi:hypothetical protein